MTTQDWVHELMERVVELSRSYAIWWELVDVKNRSIYEIQILDHEDFFAATVHAHFQSIMIVLYQLFDKRRSTKSIPNVLRSMATANPEFAREENHRILPHWPVLTRVFDIRGNVYAHRNALLSPEEVFARANLSPNVIGSLVSLAQDSVAAIGQAIGLGPSDELIEDFELRGRLAAEDIKNVLQLLGSVRSNNGLSTRADASRN